MIIEKVLNKNLEQLKATERELKHRIDINESDIESRRLLIQNQIEQIDASKAIDKIWRMF